MSSDVLGNVSRETIDRLEAYSNLLKKWNPRINLVAKSTIEEIWQRHILDSAQLLSLAPKSVQHWADLGSGGGFPGLVVAIMAMENNCPNEVTLVESDVRKCAFLRTVIRETEAPAKVINDRVESLLPLKCDVLSARALTELSGLLAYAERHLSDGGMALFPKGRTWKKELDDAQQTWKFEYQVAKSKTDEGPVILSIAGVARV